MDFILWITWLKGHTVQGGKTIIENLTYMNAYYPQRFDTITMANGAILPLSHLRIWKQEVSGQ